jgi:hypothetical protein
VRARSNSWYEAICAQLRAADGPLPVAQIWSRMLASGFQHGSKKPKSTLSARVAELKLAGRIERVAPRMYQLSEELS